MKLIQFTHLFIRYQRWADCSDDLFQQYKFVMIIWLLIVIFNVGNRLLWNHYNAQHKRYISINQILQ